MNSTRILGLYLLMPAVVLIALFFFVPVILTGMFAFTNMSTATGITGGAYQITPAALQKLTDNFELPEVAETISQPKYLIDTLSLTQMVEAEVAKNVIDELRQNHMGEIFDKRRAAEKMIKALNNRPGSTRTIKQISQLMNRSVANQRFASEEMLLDGLLAAGLTLTAQETEAIVQVSYTGWTWSANNFKRMFSLPDTRRVLINTAIYVTFTLVLFNTTFAMVLAISTFYMPARTAGIFRSIWLLPRISPPVIYVLMWKWLAWDTGFLSLFLDNFGVPTRNWMLDSRKSVV